LVASRDPENKSGAPSKSFFVTVQLHNDSEVVHSPEVTAFFTVENGDILKIDAQWSLPLTPQQQKLVPKDYPQEYPMYVQPGHGVYVYLDTNGYTSMLVSSARGSANNDTLKPHVIIATRWKNDWSCSALDLPPLAILKEQPVAAEVYSVAEYPSLAGGWRELGLQTEAAQHTEEGGLRAFQKHPCCEVALYKYFRRPVPKQP
jgi:hypothetical protein